MLCRGAKKRNIYRAVVYVLYVYFNSKKDFWVCFVFSFVCCEEAVLDWNANSKM